MRTDYPASRSSKSPGIWCSSRASVLAALALVAVLAAACSTPSTSQAVKRARRTSSVTSSAPGSSRYNDTTPSTSTTTTIAPPTTTAPAATCTTNQLSLAEFRTEAVGAGSASATFKLANTSSTTCSLSGYPQVTLLDAAGNPMPETSVQSSQYAVVTVTLVAHSPTGVGDNELAGFGVYFTDENANHTQCSGATLEKPETLRLDLPGGAVLTTLNDPHPGFPLASCNGRIAVTAIAPGAGS